MIKSNTKEIHMSGNLTDKLPNNKDSLTSIMRVVKDLTTKVEALNEKVELRLYDTRPMWEQVLKTVLELKEGQQRLEQGHERLEQGHERLEQGQIFLRQEIEHLASGQESLRRESHEIKTFCRDILRRLSIFNDTLVTIQSDYRDIYDRVRQLEESTKQPSSTDLEPI
jgi:predicted  nucleic acid-binding Zn-ribbon protein